MIRPEECAVVIPCLNEEAAIFSVVQAVKEIISTVIVIDDGSRDNTASLASKAGAEVIRNPQSLGKGAALNLGWQRARKQGFKWAFSMDGDGQHLPEDLATFLSFAEDGKSHLIVGNRLAKAKQIPWFRRQVNRWMSHRLSRIAGKTLPDSQCGFRLMNLEAWSTLSLQTTHFEIESEVLLAFIARGYNVQFVPVQVIYGREQSKINPLRDTMRWFRWLREVRKKN